MSKRAAILMECKMSRIESNAPGISSTGEINDNH